ncbi:MULTISPECIES: hypothetical protein [Cyanophyceae]|uniref:Uncharacterized protein n=1 Tax=Leptolyngbya subtilissima DQ-A4 TaxID=2933933 RepID=A0ABV0K9Z2_9CYAN|nr:hypothetical protein [Nodosilinea sp. FACHB-141]MBD2114973.1 hypothetical protein [Nodosilinea sp. FACHB-141]
MNPFVISPQEAQAIQEDEVQLVMALTQVSQRLAMTFKQSLPLPPMGQDDLRIQLGQRVVYGQLADGTIRRELNLNSLKVILDAIQQPVTPGVDPDVYRGKVPAIEIRDRGAVLFREERDGVITVNQIQMQIGEAVEQARPTAPSPALNGWNGKTPDAPSPDLTVDPEAVTQIAARLINPLNESKPIYDAVAVGDYQIKQSGHHLSVSRDDQVILVMRDGAVVSNQLQDVDRAAFLELDTRLSPAVAAEAALPELSQNGSTPPVLTVLNQAVEQSGDSPTKTLLKATIEQWQGQTLDVRVTQWLSQHLENRRNQQMARAVVELFQRGHERTGETLYQIGDYSLSRKASGDYSLRDQRGELMQVRVSKSTGLGRGIEVVSVAERVSDFQRQELSRLRHNRAAMPQGKLDVEAVYAARTRRVEHTVRNFLQSHVYANAWNKEGGQFKLEVGNDDLLRITDKWGRGVVFERHHSNVVSRLNQQDLLHFERLEQRMQLVKQQTHRQPKAQMELG